MLLVIGDYNAKIGEGRENKTVGPHGLGTRNDSTWFEQKTSARHT